MTSKGIFRLNINSELNTMDNSNIDNSPMVLDETVKFSSDSSELQIDEDEEDSEEAKLCAIIEEREALLVNCNEYKVRNL